MNEGIPEVPAARLAGTLIGHGYLAVDLFFVLSGFVMAMCYGGMFADGANWATYRLFLTRRLARVYPLYLVVTLATAAMLVVHARPPHLDFILLSNVLLVQAWAISDSLVGPAWSISTEALAYLMFPLLAAVTIFGSRFVRVTVMLLAVATLGTIALLPTAYVFGRVGPLDAHDCTTFLPVLRCLAEFSLGLLAYRLAALPAAMDMASRPGVAATLFAAIVSLLMLPGTDLLAVLLFPPLVLSLAASRGSLVRVMGGRVLNTLGLLSYSIYLLHFRFIWLERTLREHLPNSLSLDMRQVIAASVTFALLILVSAVTYTAIEKPCRTMLRSPVLLSLASRSRAVVDRAVSYTVRVAARRDLLTRAALGRITRQTSWRA